MSFEIINENHDINQIHVELADVERALDSLTGGLVWDAREYGISREQAEARIAAAKTPEARERVLADLRQRAINRAGLDTSNGRVNVFTAGKAPWHRLGVQVSEAVTSAEAVELAGLNWDVAKTPLKYVGPDGLERTQNDVFGIVRQDTGDFLGAVGSRYQPIQNSTSFEFLDAVIGEFGARYESAGSLFGGKRIWLLVHLPQQQIKVLGKDVVDCYGLFSNPHDGSGVAVCVPTSHRVVCANTLRVAIRGAAQANKGISIRHSGDIKSRIQEARRSLGLAVQSFQKFGEQTDVLARTKLPDVGVYLNDVLDSVLDVLGEDAAKGVDFLLRDTSLTGEALTSKRRELERKIQKRREILDGLFEAFESERCGVYGIRGTVWSGLNAVTEFADFGGFKRFNGNDEAKASRRFESVISGDADNLKQVAFAKALALAGSVA